MVDCTPGNYGCSGGLFTSAWQYLASNGGQCTEAAYPYQAVDGTCQDSNCTKAAKVSKSATVTYLPDEKSMMTALSKKSLVTVGIVIVNSFFSYS